MTSSFIVQSEHDMDRVISDAIQMSKDIQDIKKMRISFPTDQLAEIFLENLAGKFIEAGIPFENNLEVTIVLPNDEENNA
tara:strand:+ start:185 stop:424 length:240 start_codon:yes stop_codon:yes gene_type:complete